MGGEEKMKRSEDREGKEDERERRRRWGGRLGRVHGEGISVFQALCCFLFPSAGVEGGPCCVWGGFVCRLCDGPLNHFANEK